MRNLYGVLLIVGLLIIGGYYIYDNYISEDEEVVLTTEEKLEALSFELVDDYYVRYVNQDDEIYEEVVALEKNEFMRMVTGESDHEVYSYNYSNETFNYLYYFEDELITRMTYNYTTEKVVLDEDEVYAALEEDVDGLKTYFLELISDNNIEISEL